MRPVEAGRVRAAALTLVAAALLGTPLAAAAAPRGDADVHKDLAGARAATAQFHRTGAANAAGYAPFPEGVPLHQCIAARDPGHGAMGVHWLNAALVDTTLDPAQPEVLVYEPTKNGRLRLVAMEYVVFAGAWEAAHPGTTPQIFGMDMVYVGEPNRYELPAFWQRHAWVWRNNPAGMFADHNPAVSCRHAG